MPNKIELNTFYFSIIILLLWCIVPGYFQTYREDSIIIQGVYSELYFEEAFRYVLLLLISYIGIFLIYLLNNYLLTPFYSMLLKVHIKCSSF